MESLLHYVVPVLYTLLVLCFSIYAYYMLKTSVSKTSSRHQVPEAGGAWPILGHMHLLGSQQLTHKTLGAMADKYGPLFTIKLGSHRALVVSSWEMAKECFTTNDRAFSDRPTIAASRLLGYDLAMFGFAPYGAYWREVRKVATIELLSSQRIDMLRHIRASEVDIAVRELYENWVRKGRTESGVLQDLKKWLGDLTHNIASRMVLGKRYFSSGDDCKDEDGEEKRQYQKGVREFTRMFGVFVLSDAVPALGWLDFNGHVKTMKRTAKELDILIQGSLEKHRTRKLLGGKEKQKQDFMDVMLNIFEDTEISGFDADTIIKATCLNLIFAGSDTTLVTLTWALSLLLNNPSTLKKAVEELETNVGNDRNVEESDTKDLIYLQGIVKETLRLYPPNPVIGHRSSMEDTTFSTEQYHVPSGTRLMVNAWKIHRDKRVWSDPDEFKPERFLTSHKEVEVRGQNFELIPFGSGRRSCPGSLLGLQIVHFVLARLLHSFEVTKISSDPVDMTESSGLTNLKATPLEVNLVPRLKPELYVY